VKWQGNLSGPHFCFPVAKIPLRWCAWQRRHFARGSSPFRLCILIQEALDYRDRLVERLGEKLIVGSVQETINEKKLTELKGKFASRNALQTFTLLEMIEKHQFDGCIGGARRDEEKARAKERIFSVRNEFGQWDPKLQRPELWNIYNGKIQKGENVRVFPISNWTELDVWNYIKREKIELPSIYFSHERECLEHQGQLVAISPFVQLEPGDKIVKKKVRYRTVGDMTCTAAVESNASTIDDIIKEIIATKTSERGETRIDDRTSEAAMEDRKKNGYF
jgi:sulfate adenylyltransferase subunit 2